ncbi:MAG: hypothetical protein JXA57_01695 [Armatimonadetes bacterium]|nr:hypothetical protein [Armatimonadota bacterium]
MAYTASVIPVMIASPGDVLEHRVVIRETVQEWNYVNSLHTNVVLMPVAWETHSSPELGTRAQQLINERILKDCDLLVAVFWTRLGTPTGESLSGSVEEIERHLNVGKPAMVYFSTAPVAQETLDVEQYKRLGEFRTWCNDKGLTQTFENIVEFRQIFSRQLQIALHSNPYLSAILEEAAGTSGVGKPTVVPFPSRDNELHLSDEARQLLLEATDDKHGIILKAITFGGQFIQTNGKTFGDPSDRRSMARWEYALDQLASLDLVNDRSQKGEVFEATEPGYRLAERIRNADASS